MDNNQAHHQPELDGIRGIAVLAVLVAHAWVVLHLFPAIYDHSWIAKTLTPGWAGVDLFFVLSGFLITGILLRTRESPNYFTSFYMRRFLRIFPIYYLFLIAVFFVVLPLWERYAPGLGTILSGILPASYLYRGSYFLYLQNWPYFWRPGYQVANLLGPFWSLAVEEQFYLFWPLLVFYLRARTLAIICLVGFVLALPLRMLLMHYIYALSFGLMTLTTSRIDGLLLGSACAIYMHKRKRPVPMSWIAVAAALGGSLVGLAISESQGSELYATGKYMHTIGVSGFALLCASLVAVSQYRFAWLQRILTVRWLRSCGKYSYGMYVYHLAIFLIVKVSLSRYDATRQLSVLWALACSLACLALTYGVARFSFHFFEQRFLMQKKRFQAKPAAVAEMATTAHDLVCAGCDDGR